MRYFFFALIIISLGSSAQEKDLTRWPNFNDSVFRIAYKDSVRIDDCLFLQTVDDTDGDGLMLLARICLRLEKRVDSLSALHQYRIGDLAIPGTVFEKFTIWCYRHPDTIQAHIWWEGTPDPNIELEKQSVGRVEYKDQWPSTGYLIPKTPTVNLFIRWIKNGKP